ncbi:flagellar hook-length control protein FliK [Colwellia psychrerythraea]|uniref:Putative flagellar hook-length control protein n=1 Tax=Colwellia psychrerythraea (strain 34H / ATCC BAA-681) TaxID=167879 RepID=Q485L6_COLP3|nr:flagellar hook-length control protein FliK [Colwellia psychrerythraea]AAZ27223.1 putative flagellar hook-length control protein [Colwellia psychrerythraea 34H]
MQQVNTLPSFVSQDTDLKTKDSSSTSADSNKDTDFSSLIEQHLPEENKTTSGKKATVTEHEATATQGKTIAANDKDDVVASNSRQESDSSESVDVSDISKKVSVDEKQKKVSEANQNGSTKSGSLAESEEFISLLYNSDQTLAKAGEKTESSKDKSTVAFGQSTSATNSTNIVNKDVNGQADSVQSENADPVSGHKLSAFSKDELLARAQLKNNNTVTPQSSDQVLKDYQLSLQSQQNTIKSQSITSEQLMNTQLADAQLNNKITDLAAGVAQSNKNQLTEKVDTGLYQLPVEPIGKGNITAGDMTHSAKQSVARAEVNQGEIEADLAVKSNKDSDMASTKTVNSSSDALKVNPSNRETVTSPLSKVDAEKMVAERTRQTASVENIPKEQIVTAQEKQPVMTSAQLQALQQVQAQQKTQSVSSEPQVNDDVSEEYIDPMLLSEEKPIEQGVKTTAKVIDNIAMRTISELQAQTVQATQTKQSNDAYFEHQVSEVLNHNVASDSVQIQKNNVQLQQETISIFRKDFADAVKDKVLITINQKLQQFDITLDPPEFGNMQVRVNLQGEQASVNFVVQNQQAKEALEQNMHKLKEMLSEQGVDVGGANVEQQDQQQNQNEQSLGQNNDSGSVLTNDAQKDENNVEHILSTQLFDSSATGVDYYA